MHASNLSIIPIRALRDNYIWMLADLSNKNAFVVDPGDAEPVIHTLKDLDLHLKGILLTHHHSDHSAGIQKLLPIFDKLIVIGSHRSPIAEVNHFAKDGDTLKLLGTQLKALEIPGHTLDHIAYYQEEHFIFSGDTLFSAGCGRIFEGTAEMMYHSLQKIINLPDTTNLYCGHEYTRANLQFAKAVEPDNPFLHRKIESLAKSTSETCTLPSTLAEEKLFNPFLRCEKDTVIRAAENHAEKKLHSPVDVFSVLREWKNHF